jgi:hypothetical protein
MIATLFYNPLPMSFSTQFWLLIPLCLAVAAVYKAVRVKDPRTLPREVAALMAYMLGGLGALCVLVWLVAEYWP